jgi:hypothetical protein
VWEFSSSLELGIPEKHCRETRPFQLIGLIADTSSQTHGRSGLLGLYRFNVLLLLLLVILAHRFLSGVLPDHLDCRHAERT